MLNGNQESQFVVDKPPYDSINRVVESTVGRINIRGPIRPEILEQLSFSKGLSCFRPSCRQHGSLVELTKAPDGFVFVSTIADMVVSYVSFQKPDYPWWEERCFPELIELGTVETDPAWRKLGLTSELFTTLFNNDHFTYFEDYIVIAVHFVQSWDLLNSGLSAGAYRQFMFDLFSKYGFKNWETVDPEVREHPCNSLMARVGKNVCQDCTTLFTTCCLGTN